MPYRYPMALHDGFFVPNEHLQTWEGYKRDRCGNALQPMLCDVLHLARPDGQLSPAFAWPTLVLGSECLRLRNPGTHRVLELLPGELKDEFAREIAAMSPNSSEDEHRTWSQSALQFVEQLIHDRLGLSSSEGDELPAEGKGGARDEHVTPPDDARQDDPTAWLLSPAGLGGVRAPEGQAASSVPGSAAVDEVRAQIDEVRAQIDEVQAQIDAADQSSSYADWELELMIAAASLTQHYFTGKLESSRSVSRLALDTLTLESLATPEFTRSQTALSTLSTSLWRDELNDLDGITRLRVVTTETLNALNAGRIALVSVQALTEFAWNQVIRAFSLYSWYPEWQEFLVRLSMDNRSQPVGDGYLRPVARSTEDAANMVSAALRPTAVKSAAWYESNHPVDESARVDAYAGYAELLHRMADYRRTRLQGPTAASGEAPAPAGSKHASGLGKQDPKKAGTEVPPPVSAFVTTYDVELELAMAARHPDRAFAVALPVNLVENLEGKKLGTTMWLGYIVRPDSKRGVLDRVTQPDEDAWFIFERFADNRASLDGEITGTGTDAKLLARALLGCKPASRLGELPIIVRLAGSPLVQLPAIQDGEGGLGDLGQVAFQRAQLEGYLMTNDNEPAWSPLTATGDRAVAASFVAATLLDEHNAIRLSLPEVVGQQPDRSLPPELTAGMQGRYWRYWVLLGVEMSDPVIRYRVIAQVLGASLRAAPRTKYVSPGRRGVVLNNKRHNARALELLAWSGFDVVIDREAPGPMTRELRHFLDHLEDKNRGLWPRDGVPCRVPEIVEGEGQ